MKRLMLAFPVLMGLLVGSSAQAAVSVSGPLPFGALSDGRETHIWRLDSGNGIILDVSDYGGRLVRAYAPDRFGNLADVTLGWNTAGEYERNGFSAGTIIGRFGNRIANGTFTLDGVKYQMPINEDKAARHCIRRFGRRNPSRRKRRRASLSPTSRRMVRWGCQER